MNEMTMRNGFSLVRTDVPSIAYASCAKLQTMFAEAKRKFLANHKKIDDYLKTHPNVESNLKKTGIVLGGIAFATGVRTVFMGAMGADINIFNPSLAYADDLSADNVSADDISADSVSVEDTADSVSIEDSAPVEESVSVEENTNSASETASTEDTSSSNETAETEEKETSSSNETTETEEKETSKASETSTNDTEEISAQSEEDTNTVDGVAVDSDTPVETEDVTNEAATADTTKDSVIDMNNITDGKNVSITEGQETEVVFPTVTGDDNKTIAIVLQAPDGTSTVVMAPDYELDYDKFANYLSDLYKNGKIAYNPLDASTYPDGIEPNWEVLPGIKTEGSTYETSLGTLSFYRDADGTIHMYTGSDVKSMNVVNQNEGMQVEDRKDPDKTDDYKPAETPTEAPTTPEIPSEVPTEAPTTGPETPTTSAPRTGDDYNAIPVIGATVAGAGLGLAHELSKNKQDVLEGYDNIIDFENSEQFRSAPKRRR